jgi:DNA modification methylase
VRNDLLGTASMQSIKVIHGDYRVVLKDVIANLIFTSPPYNIGSEGPSRTGFRKLGLFDPKSYRGIRDYPDIVAEPEYQDQQAGFMGWAARRLAPGGILAYNHKPRRRNKQMIHPAEWFLRPEVRECLPFVEEGVWDRGSTHNHAPQLLWPQTERIYVFRRTCDEYQFRNHSGLPQRSDVWRLPRGPLNGHACPFPIKLANAVIEAWSKPGDLVCDPYLGSGTTALAAIGLGRRFIGAEVLEKYVRQAELAISANPWERAA